MARPTRPKRVTAKSVICDGLLAGDDDHVILAKVKELFPDSAADQTHVNFYRAQLKKENRLVQQAGVSTAVPRADVPDFSLRGRIEVGGMSINVYGSMLRTYDEVKDLMPGSYVRPYVTLTGDHRPDFSLRAAKKVVLYAVTRAWYEYMDRPIPESVLIKEAQARQEAAMAKKTQDEATKTPKGPKPERVTNKSIICNGLLAGQSDEQILAAVKKHNSETKADGSHISYYKSYLYKTGQLERPAKPEKAAPVEKPAKAAKAAAAPAAAAPAAKKTAAKKAKA